MLDKIKKLLTKFIECFLINKKVWISEQSTIGTEYTETKCEADNQEHQFIMPYSGYAVIKGFGIQYVDINGTSLVNGGFISNDHSFIANLNIATSVYLKKGQQSYYNIGQGGIYIDSYIRFYKTNS